MNARPGGSAAAHPTTNHRLLVTGARGLRMILEDLMLDLMYYLPSYKKVREFQVTKEMVLTQKISLTILEKAG